MLGNRNKEGANHNSSVNPEALFCISGSPHTVLALQHFHGPPAYPELVVELNGLSSKVQIHPIPRHSFKLISDSFQKPDLQK